MSYEPRDRVFAKVRGHPHWPARINIVPEGSFIPKGKHPIFFYGTHEVYSLAPKDLYPYEQWKHKYGIPKKNNALFQKGLEEIEQNPDILLLGTDPAAEDFLSQFYPTKSFKSPPPITKSSESKEDSSESQKLPLKPQGLYSVDLDAAPPEQPITAPLSHPTPSPMKRTQKCSTVKSSSTSSTTKRTKRTSTAAGRSSNAGNSNRKEQGQDDEHGEIVEEVEIRKEKEGAEMPNQLSTNLDHNEPPATTSTGRPMRKSAAKFLNAKPYKYVRLSLTHDKPSSKRDLDWKPSGAPFSNGSTVPCTSKADTAKSQEGGDAFIERHKEEGEGKSEGSPEEKATTKHFPSPLVDANSSSSTLLSSPSRENRDVNRRKRRASREQSVKKRIRLSSTSSAQRPNRKSSTSQVEKPRMKVSNVSMTPEELNARLNNRLNTQNGAKQLNELDTEAKLHQCYLGIKKSLIRGQENLSACIQRMEIVEKLPITLPILVKCFPIIETIKKCTRYTRSDGVKIGALRLHNKFWSIFENATKDEKREAQTALAEVRRNSSNQGGPATVEAIFANKDSSSNSTSGQQTEQTPSKESIKSEQSHPASPTSTAPVQQSLVHPPVDLPPALSPRPISYQDAPLSPSALIKSDSEGLAVSDNESPRSDLEFQRSFPPHPNSGEIISAARRAFHQHTTRVDPRHPPDDVVPQTESDSYEPQPLYVSSQPLPTYNPFHGEIVDGLPPPPPVQSVPENRRTRVPLRERPRSPHALPHPLEHYQRFLNNGEQQSQQLQPRQSYPQPTQPSGDLDSRIAQLLCHSQRGEKQHHFVENPSSRPQQYHQPPQPHSTPLPPIGVLSSSHPLQRPPPQNIMRGPYGPPPMRPQHVMGPSIPPPPGVVYPSMPSHHSTYSSGQMMPVVHPGPPYSVPPSHHPYSQPQDMVRAPVDSQQWPPTQMRYHGAPGSDDLYKQQGGGGDSGPH
ncbi:unnamed protein product [Hymenolepis diminuta]|uniref:PWWP domain-containing protein n=1 Tax=Hymenolepis diminuta TaxID=6216 RepID=A0A564YQF7_HYMDI|nr:unnamed protein product [Hymenolepis diminuta]